MSILCSCRYVDPSFRRNISFGELLIVEDGRPTYIHIHNVYLLTFLYYFAFLTPRFCTRKCRRKRYFRAKPQKVMRCIATWRPPDVSPLVLAFYYEAHTIPAHKFNTSATSFGFGDHDVLLRCYKVVNILSLWSHECIPNSHNSRQRRRAGVKFESKPRHNYCSRKKQNEALKVTKKETLSFMKYYVT